MSLRHSQHDILASYQQMYRVMNLYQMGWTGLDGYGERCLLGCLTNGINLILVVERGKKLSF